MKPSSASTNPEQQQQKPSLVGPEAKPAAKGADDILALIVMI